MIKVFINKEWISGRTCTFTIDSLIERRIAEKEIMSMRLKFIEKLQAEGLEIITDNSKIDDDTICLIMDEFAFGRDVNDDEWKKMFDEKIALSAGEDFHFPKTVTLEEFFNNPFFPAVFKNEVQNGGKDKFIIETLEQMEVIRSFYEKHSQKPFYKKLFSSVVMQQFINNPGKFKTYLRVLVDGNGESLGASLKYANQGITKTELAGDFENIFLNQSSEYFINAKKTFNYYAGGGNIHFSQPKFSDEKRAVLESHGLDPKNLALPDEVLSVTRNIMAKCNREIGVLCGIDFILNEYDGHWYYLENQAFPAIDEWAQKERIPLPTSHDVKGYLKVLEIELQTRYIALMNVVNKKRKEQKL